MIDQPNTSEQSLTDDPQVERVALAMALEIGWGTFSHFDPNDMRRIARAAVRASISSTPATTAEITRDERLDYERRILAAEVEWVSLARKALAFCLLMERNTSQLDAALFIANQTAERQKLDRFVVEGWMPRLLALKDTIESNPLFPDRETEDELIAATRPATTDEASLAERIDDLVGDLNQAISEGGGSLATECRDTLVEVKALFDSPATTDEVERALADADWLNAETCIENIEIAIEGESLCDEDGPVDTCVSSGDLFVLLSLAKSASRARAAIAALASTPAKGDARGHD